MRGDKRYVLESDYNGCTLYTDGLFFFAEGSDRKVMAEAKSLEALKHKVLKPKTLNIEAVRLEDRWSYSDDDFKPERVKVYAVTAAGNILYSKPDGSKDKDSYDSLRLYDPEKVERFIALKAAKAKAEADLKALFNTWPKLKAKQLYADQGPTIEKEED